MIKKSLITTIALLVIFIGCANNGYRQNSTRVMESYPSSLPNPIDRQTATTNSLNGSIKSALAYMYDEERLAKELYLAINQKQPVKQLYNIATKAEGRHINAVNNLAKKYGVATPPQVTGRYAHAEIQNLFNRLYAKGIRSKKDALEVGCIAEVIDINDLNRYITQAQQANAEDLLQTFTFLRKGSYNHYWAFDKGLKQLGITTGCCSLGQQYCHPEYPKKEHQKGGRQRGGWRG